MKSYLKDGYAMEFMDTIQQTLECCGSFSYRGWKDNLKWELQEANHEVPWSCCNPQSSVPCLFNNLSSYSYNNN